MKHLFSLLLLLLVTVSGFGQIFSPNRPDNIPRQVWRQLPRDVRQDVKEDYKFERKLAKERENTSDTIFIPPGESVALPLTPAVADVLSYEANWGRVYLEWDRYEDQLLSQVPAGQKYAIVLTADTGFPDNINLEPYIYDQFVRSYTGEPVLDNHGHATHVIGSIVGHTTQRAYGIAAKFAEAGLVKIAIAKVCTGSGSCPSSGIAQSIREFTDATQVKADQGHPRYINLSLGGGENAAMRQAIEYATSKGVIVVAANGNRGVSPPSFPGIMNETVGVGAIDRNGDKANFSQFGPTTQYAAPGVLIPSLCIGNRECVMSGTSMATPHIVGVLACLDLANAGLTNPELLNYAAVYATDLGEPGHDHYYGHGAPKLKQYLDNPADGNEEPDEPDDPGDGGDNPGIIRENRTLTYELEGEWTMPWMTVQASSMTDEPAFIIDLDKNTVANFDGVATITYIQVAVETNTDAGTTFELTIDNTNTYHHGRGLGLRSPADVSDAVGWSSYFYDMLLDKGSGNLEEQEVHVLKVRGHDQDGTPITLNEDDLRHWPRR